MILKELSKKSQGKLGNLLADSGSLQKNLVSHAKYLESNHVKYLDDVNK